MASQSNSDHLAAKNYAVTNLFSNFIIEINIPIQRFKYTHRRTLGEKQKTHLKIGDFHSIHHLRQVRLASQHVAVILMVKIEPVKNNNDSHKNRK